MLTVTLFCEIKYKQNNNFNLPRLCSNSHLGQAGINNKKIGTEELLRALTEEEDFWPFCNLFLVLCVVSHCT